MNDNEQLDLAKWVLERNLGWIAAAEVKVGVVVAIDTAMLALLAGAFSSTQPHERTAWAYLCTVAASGLNAWGIFCCAMSMLPRVDGPPSLVFFGKIASYTRPDYETAFRKADALVHLSDCLSQVHRNAEIACDKFRWVRRAMWSSFLSVLPWIGAVAVLVKT